MQQLTSTTIMPQYLGMKKSDLIEHLGGTAEKAAHALDLAHRNSVQRYPEELTERQCKDVIRRMKALGIKYPRKWNVK